MPHPPTRSPRTGLLAGASAYVWWGLSPLYFKLFLPLSPAVILAHRVVWSVLFLAACVLLQRATPELLRICRSPRTLATLCLTGALVACNWGVFIYAVTTDHILEASLGYFLTPLLQMLLGVTVLKERLRPLQLLATLLAASSLVYLLLAGGPSATHLWIPAGLAGSFGFYALFRKVTPVSPTNGTLVETAFLTPAALLVLYYTTPAGTVPPSLLSHPLLLTSGAFTSIPLLLFATAARSLRLITVGFLQYIGPTLQFVLAVTLYEEKFTPTHATTFTLIWLALAIYTYDSLRAYHSSISPVATPLPAPL
jgi:chloramphenicol-sensitive protein RarD